MIMRTEKAQTRLAAAGFRGYSLKPYAPIV